VGRLRKTREKDICCELGEIFGVVRAHHGFVRRKRVHHGFDLTDENRVGRFARLVDPSAEVQRPAATEPVPIDGHFELHCGIRRVAIAQLAVPVRSKLRTPDAAARAVAAGGRSRRKVRELADTQRHLALLEID
jgi:hypothetical protein